MKKYLKAFKLYLFLVLLTGNISAQLSEWRGPERSGIYPDENLLKKWPENGPTMLWYKDSLGSGYSSPTVTKNAIYITGRKDSLELITALDHQGHVLWETVYGSAWERTYRESRTTPTFYNDKLFVVSGSGELSVLNTEGKIIWTVDFLERYQTKAPKFGICESPLVFDNKVVITPGGHIVSLVAFDIMTGKVIWEAPPVGDEAQYGSPKLYKFKGKDYIATLMKNRLLNIDAQTGDSVWTFYYKNYESDSERPRTNHTLTPIFQNGCLFITGGYDYTAVKLKIFENSKRPEIQWTNKDIDPHHGGVVLLNNYLYSSNWENNSKGNWICVNWETGKTEWVNEWHTKGSIISADNMLYCYEEKKGHFGLFEVDSESFSLISEFKVPRGTGPHWSHPVIDEGKLYIRHGKSLMVYGLKEKE